MGNAESPQAQQLAQQVQTVPVHEKSNLDNNRAVSAPDDEGFFLLCTVSLLLLMNFILTYVETVLSLL
jgi:hypothetical protein